MSTTKKSSKSKKKAAGKADAKAAVANTKAATTTDEVSGRKATTKQADGEAKSRRVSALDAAALVLAQAGQPMRAQDLIAAMAEQGLWKSPAGKTPHATLYAAMTREARDKGAASRFRRVDRGQFASNA